ncbi:MAG: 3-deoxy-D-manno-octulosonic acid transferase [Paludibacteraceae bacterium]|nr:3-deoxy-D-manno-octulosonic acid transferase [Paludibacteraceae bacterium]
MGKKIIALLKGQREALDKEHIAQLQALRGAIWIHSASVGEFEQARPIIEQLKIKNEKLKIVLTFFSPSGYELRKNYELVDGVFYLPFPNRHNANKFLDALQPSKALFVKYEFWPPFLRVLKKRNIPTYSISAIFRPTQRFFHWYGKSSLNLLKCFTHLYVQDEASRALLAEHGIANCTVTGDTRFDRVKAIVDSQKSKNDSRFTPIAQFVEGAERVLVAGSTWPKDEVLLAQLKIQNEKLKIILVPHEINEEHLHFIFNLFEGKIIKYSVISNQPSNESRVNILKHAQVMVLDTIGLLSSIYRFGQVAYIGGGFGVGIHNTIEAAVYGVPVLFGPNYHHFREAQGLIDAGAARSISNYAELEEALETAFAQHETIGAKAAQYVESELGATEKIYKEIF